jgi:diguanylate cyclase (GGDEF)-like protein/PAS domain S-box-containing protein
MKREVARGAPWRDSWGVIIAVVSAALLILVLWQVSQMSKEAGLDRETLQRERIAVAETKQLVGMIDALDAFRYALVLDRPNRRVLAGRAARALNGIDTDFRTGEASVLGVSKRWNDLHDLWRPALRAQPGTNAYEDTAKAMGALPSFLSEMQDASDLTYDPSVLAQNIANTYVQETPYGIMASDRLKMLIDLSAKNRGMTLTQRLVLANSLNSVRTDGDVSGDNLALVATMLTALMPEGAAKWNQLPLQAIEMYDASARYGDLVGKHALLETTGPSLPLSTFAAAARDFRSSAMRLHVAAGNALDASLAKRGEIQALRNRYVYMAFVLGSVVLVSLMISIAQLIARRDRAALRVAQQQSEQLQTELARQQAEQALRLSEAQFKAVFDGAAVGIAVVDRHLNVVDANNVFRSMFGGSILTAIEGHDDELMALFSGERETFEFEQSVRAPSGEIWTDATVSIVSSEENHPLYAICMFRDKTALKHSERRSLHDKTHDLLTGLPNRQLFEQYLQQRFDEASALLDSFFAVMFVDLDNFKDVNESMGHSAGDMVLTQVAGRMRSAVDARDVVARLGSDEFAVLIQSLGDILHVESVARRILNNLSKPMNIGSKTIYLNACIGIAFGSSSYERADDVTRDAEIAMQHAKSSGGGRYAVFDSKMHERAQKRLQLTSDLRRAIERGEFRVLYQPIVTIADGRLVGAEALIRWDHPTEGVINPIEFIPLAEQTGMASAIGRIVAQTAAEQLASWRRNRGGTLDLTVNVNVSASELVDPDFERRLVQVIEQNGLAASDITLEITENVVLDTATRANVTLERLRDRGFGICIDDFGTGYSSLRYLQQFKVDAIKIDRSFVAGADGELASEPIVRTLMTLAEEYGVRVVAEGVETSRQRDVLRGAGCRFAQGFLFARPLSAGEMATLYPEVLGRVARSASA